ncbi:UPF0451 C17orf61-like protein, partial [Zea mays]
MLVVTDPMLWHKVAAVSGVAALGLGTYGAHMFRPKNPTFGTQHPCTISSTPRCCSGRPSPSAPTLYHGGLLTAGIVLFSGTCYTVAYLEDRKFSSPAPLGGFAFIAAWASLLCVYYV